MNTVNTMSPCQTCGAAMVRIVEETPTGTANRAVCSVWVVHPPAMIGLSGHALPNGGRGLAR